MFKENVCVIIVCHKVIGICCNHQTDLAFIYDKYHSFRMELGFHLRFLEIRSITSAAVS